MLIGRAIKVFLVTVIAAAFTDEITAQPPIPADVPASCTVSDPLFAHRLSKKKDSLHAKLSINRLRLDELESQHAAGHPEVVAAEREVEVLAQRLDTADEVARNDCIETVMLLGEWAPDGLTLEDWREIIGETQRTAYRVFDVLESSFGPVPAEGCPGMPMSGLETYSEGKELPGFLPPCSFSMFVIDWDERRSLYFVREDDAWIRFIPPEYW